MRSREPLLPLPTYMTSGSAGMDLYADVESPVVLAPLDRVLIPTGIAMALPEGFEGQIRPRSGLALKEGLTMVNSPGTIDSDYRGEVKLIAINLGREPLMIERGERIAQLVVQRVSRVEWQEVENLSPSQREAGGFGHTDADSKVQGFKGSKD